MVAAVVLAALLSLQVGQTGFDQKSIPGTMCLPRNLAWTDWAAYTSASNHLKGLRNVTGSNKFASCPVVRDKLNANLYDFVVKANNPSAGTVACILYSCAGTTGLCSTVGSASKQSTSTNVTLYWQDINGDIPAFSDTYVVECQVPAGATLMQIAWTETGGTD